MIDHLSSSQISLYQQCSLKYRFRYIDEIEVPYKPSNLAFGSAIHSSLDWYHSELLKGRGVEVEKLKRSFATDWYLQRLETDIRYKKGENADDLETMGKDMLERYCFVFDDIQVSLSEAQFRIPIVNPYTGEELGVPFEGYIDLIESKNIITEFKTSAKKMAQADADNLMQLTIYGYVYEALHGTQARLLKIVNFIKTKNPEIGVLYTKRSEKDYVRFFNIAKQVLAGIMLEIFYPNHSWMCKTCEYIKECAKWRG